MKTIYCMRHAKAVTGDAVMSDRDRPLAPQGETSAQQMGDYLRAAHFIPELVLCSEAVRTRQTLEHVIQSLGQPLVVQHVEKLYLASAADIMQQIHRVPEHVSSVMVVGHNPGMHQFCMQLSSEHEGHAWDDLSLSFPTASLAVFECDVPSWLMIDHGDGHLKEFLTPKTLPARV